MSRFGPPIFILGVPRSGTTLLRTILDAHSGIASGPETPWLGGHQPRSLMSLWTTLREEVWGYCKSFNMGREVPTEAARAFLCVLMERYAAARGKRRWAEKTPDNALHVDFLTELFPEARFVHLVRDGLDVAMSTSVIAPHRRGISNFLEQNLGFGPDAPPLPNTPFAALLRWNHWNNLIRKSLGRGAGARETHTLSYERLVTEPESTLRALMQFVGEPFEPGMLEFAKSRHDYPEWEWGSADVKARPEISSASVGRARRELPAEHLALLAPLAAPSVTEFAAAPTDRDAGTELVAGWVRSLAAAWGLDSIRDAAGAASLWRAGLVGHDWRGKRVVVFGGRGGPVNPLPWILALLGASVSFPGVAAEAPALRMATGLRVDMTFGSPPSTAAAGAMVVDAAASPAEVAAATKVGAPVFLLATDPSRWSADPRFAGAPAPPDAAGAVLIRRG